MSAPAAEQKKGAEGRPLGGVRSVERGQALVEFALVVPFLIALAFGVFDFGRLFSLRVALDSAAAEGARYCARFPADVAGTRARVTTELAGKAAPDLSLTTCPSTPHGEPVTVAAGAPFSPVTPYITQLTGAQVTVTASATAMTP